MKNDVLDDRAQGPQHNSAWPLVSIGVPAYNGARFLAEALESALAQEYSPLELIVSDDASSDETGAICQRFADADPRVRYLRNSSNVGAVENFRRALEAARGKYFTWLGQDDLFTRTDYLRTVVSYLEHTPDVICCAGPFTYYDMEVPGPGVTVDLAEISPDRPWRAARREFFAWPQRQVYLTLYGTFRRAELMKMPFVKRKYKGRPTADCWEMPTFTVMVGRGRIVALPSPARGYRSHLESDGFRISRGASPFDFLLLGLWMKAILIRNAWRLPVPLVERLDLLRLTIGNLFRANIRRPTDYRALADMYAREHALLREAAARRWDAIVVLRQAIEQDRERLRAVGLEPGPSGGQPCAGPEVGATGGGYDLLDDLPLIDLERSSLSPLGRLIDLFRPPPPSLVKSTAILRRQIGVLRTVCAERLRLIEDLDAELRRYRMAVHQEECVTVAGNVAPSALYGAYYFAHDCGRPYERTDEWLSFFDAIAAGIARDIAPSSVLDAGCAMGFLVESLRARGIEAFGLDASEYAIARVHESVKPYCRVGSISAPLPRRYDLIVCIEVLEHLPAEEAGRAVERLCQSSDDILVSSTPDDYREDTHFNVQPPEYWAALFARCGFLQDVEHDMSFITPWAMRFRRHRGSLADAIVPRDRQRWLLKKENRALRERAIEIRTQLAEYERQINELRAKLAVTEASLEVSRRSANQDLERLRTIERTRSWRLVRRIWRVRRRLGV